MDIKHRKQSGQVSFSRLWDYYTTDKEAMQARNKYAKHLQKQGLKTHRWVLRNQMKKYDGFGQYNGKSCNVYMVDWSE